MKPSKLLSPKPRMLFTVSAAGSLVLARRVPAGSQACAYNLQEPALQELLCFQELRVLHAYVK